MRKIYVVFFLSFFLYTGVQAQPWQYDFGTGSGSFSSNNSASITFLNDISATPSGGGVFRVRRSNNQGGGFVVANPGTSLGTGSELQINASTGGSSNKFGVYDWSNATDYLYVSFKLRTTSTDNGVIAFALGNSTLASGNNGYSSDYNNALTTFWITYSSGSISSVTRRNLGSNTSITGHGFAKDSDQEVVVFGNNSSSSTSYYYSGNSYSLNAQSWDLWVDGTKVSPANGWSRSNNPGLSAGNLTGFSFYAESSTSNVAYAYIDDLAYSSALPCLPPSTQVSTITFDNIDQNSLDFSWTNGSGAGRVVKMNTSNSFSPPANGTNPSASTIWANSGEQVVFNGTGGGPVTVTGLVAGQTYWFRAYEYCDVDRNYQSSSSTDNPNSVQTLSAGTTITVSADTYGPYCNSTSQNISVAFTPSGSFNNAFKVQLSNASGTFPNNASDNIIGTGASSPISATIPSGQAAGTGYRVRVVNDNPVTLSENDNGSDITIHAPASISVQPVDRLILEGEGTTFSVTASNATGFQWQVNTGSGWSDITNGGVYSGATTHTLSLSNVPSSYSGNQYRCIIEAGSCSDLVSGASTLTVNIVCLTDASGYTGWTISGASVSSSQACSGNGILFTGTGQHVITPAVLNPQKINFNKKRSTNTEGWQLIVSISTSASGPWADVGSTTIITNACTANPEIDVSGYPGIQYIRFMDARTNGAPQRGIDDISVTCLAPCNGTPYSSPTLQPFTGVEAESFTINFSGDPRNKRLVVVREGSAVTGTPVNSTTYTANPEFGVGGTIAAGEYVVYYGFGNSVNVTGLDRNTTYHVAIFESCVEQYNTTPATGSQATTNALITVTQPDEMEYEFTFGPSAPQTFTVSGTGLVPAAGNLTVTAPSNFQVATDPGGPYNSSVNLAYTGSTLSVTTVYVRMDAGLGINIYSGDATVSGGTAKNKQVAFNGLVYPTDCSDLFISEYVEGSSFNKLIEIYNPTGSSISLTNYRLRVYSNGSNTPTTTTVLSGSIAAYGTYIVANPSETWEGTPNLTTTNMNFNGDDVVELYRVDINSPLDIIGRIGEQPDDGGWFSGSHSTLNRTLVRKPNVTKGVRINPSSGFPTLESEWLVYDIDEFAFLGSHLSICQNTNVTWIEDISPLPLCNGSDISVQYQAAGTYSSNTFYLELSNASGNFSTPSTLATFSGNGTNLSGTINATIPGAIAIGLGYRLRLRASNPSGTVMLPSVPIPIVFAPENATSASAVLFSPVQASVSWTNPTSCFDEIVVFMKEGSPVSITPTGNGNDYDVFVPDGCTTPENAVVYKGDGSSVLVSEIDNSITYHFKIFTRKGTTWSSGVAVSIGSGQNFLDPGDLILLGLSAADTCGAGSEVDAIFMMSFREISPGTTFDVTDNGWERVNTGKWGGTEGFYRMTYTGATAIQAGQVFVLYFDGSFDITATQALNPDWQIIKYGTGSLNISVVGDQLFFLQGGTWENAVPSAHNATYTGGRAIYAFDTNPTWESLAGNSNKSGLPEFARCVEHRPLSAVARFMAYAGPTSATDRVTWLQRLYNTSNWTTYTLCSSFKTYMDAFPSSLSITADAASNVQWTGSQSTNWFDCLNWQSRVIPTSGINVVIPNTTNKPSIAANAVFASLYNGKAYTRDLTINNGGRLDMNGNANNILETSGNLLINSGGQFNMDDGNSVTQDGTFILHGNWTNNAGASGFVEGQSKVIFKGSDEQTLFINSSLTEAFHQLFVQKPSQTALVLNSPVSTSATGSLAFKCGGYIHTGSHHISILNPHPDSLKGFEPPNDTGEYDNDRYIFGELRRQIDRVAVYDFPVGDALSGERYNPFSLNITDVTPGSGQVSGRFIAGSPGTINDTHIFFCPFSSTRKFHEYTGMTGEGWWRLTGPDYGYDITLHPNIVNLNVVPNDDIEQYRDVYRAIKAPTGTGGGTWPSSSARDGDLCVVGEYYAAPGAGYVGFSDFGIPGGTGYTTALPIELLLFSAKAIDNRMVLTEWITASERNNALFTVERSKNAIDFEVVGSISGAGNSSQLLFYDFIDYQPYAGVSYYRLKQTDFDGTFSYSRVEQVFIAPRGVITVYPNPAKGKVIVELPVSVYPYMLTLYDMRGRKVLREGVSGAQQYALQLEGIAPGMYILEVLDGGTRSVFKILVQE